MHMPLIARAPPAQTQVLAGCLEHRHSIKVIPGGFIVGNLLIHRPLLRFARCLTGVALFANSVIRVLRHEAYSCHLSSPYAIGRDYPSFPIHKCRASRGQNQRSDSEHQMLDKDRQLSKPRLATILESRPATTSG